MEQHALNGTLNESTAVAKKIKLTSMSLQDGIFSGHSDGATAARVFCQPALQEELRPFSSQLPQPFIFQRHEQGLRPQPPMQQSPAFAQQPFEVAQQPEQRCLLPQLEQLHVVDCRIPRLARPWVIGIDVEKDFTMLKVLQPPFLVKLSRPVLTEGLWWDSQLSTAARRKHRGWAAKTQAAKKRRRVVREELKRGKLPTSYSGRKLESKAKRDFAINRPRKDGRFLTKEEATALLKKGSA